MDWCLPSFSPDNGQVVRFFSFPFRLSSGPVMVIGLGRCPSGQPAWERIVGGRGGHAVFMCALFPVRIGQYSVGRPLPGLEWFSTRQGACWAPTLPVLGGKRTGEVGRAAAYNIWKTFSSRSSNASTSSCGVILPQENRMVPRAWSRSIPMAVSTGDTLSVPAWQAAPADTPTS